MIIKTTRGNFSPENFEILDFYSEKTIFIWQNDEFVYFPLKTSEKYISSPPENLKINKLIKAPSVIKKLKSYKERVFFICEPRGIYKLVINNNIETFRVVSSTGIEIAEEFYKNLTIKDNYLWLQNKQEKISCELFYLNNSSTEINSIKIEASQVTDNLKNLIFNQTICLIANNYLLYKLTDNKTKLIYKSDYKLTDFLVIKNQSNKINNLLLKTANKKLLILIGENLEFKKIFFNYEIENCVGFFDQDIKLIIANNKIYFVSFNVITDSINYHNYLDQEFKDLKIINSKIWGLCAGELKVLDPEFRKMEEKDEFLELKSSMCSGTSVIVDNICDLSKELKLKNEKLLVEQDKLKKINIYAHKSKILEVKKIWVERTSCCIFLRAAFEGNLPKDCWIRVGVFCKDQEFFSMQIVEDGKIGVELPLPVEFFDNTAEIFLDLVTLVEENKPWFVVKNCEKKVGGKEKENLKSFLEKKKNFLGTKLEAVRAFDGEEDFKKICNVKKSLRREITEF